MVTPSPPKPTKAALCLISGEYPPVLGGVGDYTFNLAQQLSYSGLKVEVITRKSGANDPVVPESFESEAGKTKGPVTVSRILPGNWFGPVACWQLSFHLCRKPYKLILLQYVPHLYGRAGIAPMVAVLPLILRVLHIPCICMFHEIQTRWDEPTNPPFKIRLQWFFQLIQALLLIIFSQKMITSNPAYAQRLNRLARLFWQNKTCEVIPVGSNIPLSKLTGEERLDLQSGLDLKAGGPLLLVFSPFTVSKDLEICLGVLRRVPQARLVCVGGNPDPKRLAAFQAQAQNLGVEERLRLLPGPLPASQISHWLQIADVYLHPAKGGASGRSGVLAAALQHGLPVIAYQGAETSGAFKDGENILLVAPGDAAAIVTQLERLASDPVLVCTLRSGAAELYRATASWEIIAHHFTC